jgi:NAD(P)-dependent dehydrogenase (short-subunit alcohol dehydrogenase family)
VTGAGNGLGRAHALALAAAGARVVVNDVGGDRTGDGADASPADQVVAEIVAAGGDAVANHLPVGAPDTGEALVAQALDTWGRLDAVVNNAGILRDRTIAKMSVDELESVLRVHLLGSFYVAQAAYRHMKEQRAGRLVHTTSGGGVFGASGQLNYAAAKAGIVGMSRTFAIEGARYGITSNCVAPLARTRLSGDVFGPLNERLVPEAVSPAVVFLASPQCQLTGEVISAGGGRFARMFSAFTPGWTTDDPSAPVTADEVAAHLDEILDTSTFTIGGAGADEVMQLFQQWAAVADTGATP